MVNCKYCRDDVAFALPLTLAVTVTLALNTHGHHTVVHVLPEKEGGKVVTRWL